MTAFVQKGASDSSTHYLYLLVALDHSRFKIGVSVEPMGRAKDLRQGVDLGQSLQIGYSRINAYRRERYLHALYRDFNVDPDVVGPARFGDGRTEWFRIECFPACEKLLRRAEAFDPAALTPVQVICPAPTRTKGWLDECMEAINDPLFQARISSSYK